MIWMNRKRLSPRAIIFISFLILALTIVLVLMFAKPREEAIFDITVAPSISDIPLEGTWQVKNQRHLNTENPTEFLNEDLYISRYFVGFGGQFTLRPTFQARYVNIDNYIDHLYTKFPWKNYFTDEYYKIIMVSEGQNFNRDFIQISEDELMMVFNNNIYIYEKESDKVDEKIIAKYEKKEQSIGVFSETSQRKDLGVLLGFQRRFSREEERASEYYTIFLRIHANNRLSLYKTDKLFVPRSQSFWVADSGKSNDENYYLNLYEFGTNTPRYSSDKITQEVQIQYIGPDYISLLNRKGEDIQYNIYSLDDMGPSKALEVKNIAGVTGEESFEDQIKALGRDSLKDEETKIDFTDIGLRRNHGKWQFITGIYNKEDSSYRSLDLDLIPDVNIIKETELPMPWTNVRNLNHQAVDAVASPDGRIIIIQTLDELLIYDLTGQEKLLYSVLIDSKDQLVLNEWAIGNYANFWEEEFIKTDRVPIHYRKE